MKRSLALSILVTGLSGIVLPGCAEFNEFTKQMPGAIAVFRYKRAESNGTLKSETSNHENYQNNITENPSYSPHSLYKRNFVP